MENSMEDPQKLKIELPWSNSSPFCIYLKKTETRISKKYLHTHVNNSIIHNSQDMEATEMSISGWMEK
jgi:hypothetical protein